MTYQAGQNFNTMPVNQDPSDYEPSDEEEMADTKAAVDTKGDDNSSDKNSVASISVENRDSPVAKKRQARKVVDSEDEAILFNGTPNYTKQAVKEDTESDREMFEEDKPEEVQPLEEGLERQQTV